MWPAGTPFRTLLFALFCASLMVACGAPQNPNRIHDRGLERPAMTPTRYFPKDPDAVDREQLRGEASWYGAELQGNRTANGERFDMYSFTAAHRTLPFNSLVRATRVDDRRSVVVRINDRGPGSRSRCIDLAWAAAYEIGMDYEGHTEVTLEVIHWGDGAVYER